MNKVGDMRKYTGPNWVFDMSGDVLFWQRKADELKYAADLLWDAVVNEFDSIRECVNNNFEGSEKLRSHPSVIKTFVFIAGLSIENLLKGMIVIMQPDCIMDGKLRGKFIQSHNLSELAIELKIILTEEEKLFFELAGEAITSFGRYPLPKDISKMNDQLTIKFTIKEVYDNLYLQLLRELNNRSPWRQESET